MMRFGATLTAFIASLLLWACTTPLPAVPTAATEAVITPSPTLDHESSSLPTLALPNAPALSPAAMSTPVPGWNRRTVGGGGGQAGIAIDPTNSDIIYVTTDNGGIIKSTDGGETWFSINHNIGNRLLGDIELDPLDPQVLYVLAEVYSESPSWNDDPANGELYRSRDGGQTWEIVYALGMGGGRVFSVSVWPSTRSILIPHDPADPRRFDADGDRLSDVIYIGGWDRNEGSGTRRGGIWKTTNAGRTFRQQALNDLDIWVLTADPRDSEVLYAGTSGDGLWVSRDGGETWESWRERIPLPMISDVVVDPVNDAIYVATNTYFGAYRGDEYQSQRGLYKSVDGGRTFRPINIGLEDTSLSFERLWLDVTDPQRLTLYTGTFFGERQGMFVTRNGGGVWLRMSVEYRQNPEWLSQFENLWDIAQVADSTLIATSWRGIYKYDASNQRWMLKVNGLGNIGVRAVAFEPGNNAVIYLATLDGPPHKSTDWGATWSTIGEGFVTADGQQAVGAQDFAISPAAPQIVYATGVGGSGSTQSGVLKSVDGGQRWERLVNGLPPTQADDPQWQAYAIAVSQHDPDIAYVALALKAGTGSLYKTLDGGKNWREVLAVDDRLHDLAISRGQPETVVAVSFEGAVYVSDNAGEGWRVSNLPARFLVYAVDIAPDHPERIVIGVNVLGAFLSQDGGRTWAHVFDSKDLAPFMAGLALSPYARERYTPTIAAVKFDPQDPETMYIGHDPGIWMGVGVLKSTDSGQTWTSLAEEKFQMRSVSSIDVDALHKNLVVGSWEVYYYAAGSQ